MKLKNAAQITAWRGRQHPRRHDGGDGVGGVVEPVDEVEHQRDREMGISVAVMVWRIESEVSIAFATSSHRSVTASRGSKISFSLISEMGSAPFRGELRRAARRRARVGLVLDLFDVRRRAPARGRGWTPSRRLATASRVTTTESLKQLDRRRRWW